MWFTVIIEFMVAVHHDGIYEVNVNDAGKEGEILHNRYKFA